MKRILLAFLCLMMLSGVVMAQGMSDEQAVQAAIELKKSGKSDVDIAASLMKQGVTMEQVQRIRSQYADQITKAGKDKDVDNAIAGAEDRLRSESAEPAAAEAAPEESEPSVEVAPSAPVQATEALSPTGSKVFGRDIFNNGNLTFEPQMNIATPQNYVLGPGDQLIIDVYGQSQESLKLTVTPDGDIVIPDFGPVKVEGLTVEAAQARIRSKIGGYFQSSQIKTSLGKTRSILVNIMGEVRVPGTYTLSSFSTVFHALYMAGGIGELGTLRNIRVFRQGKLVTVVDVYEFILNGRLAGNIRLEDNDVIQVPTYNIIVDISGPVKRPMAYELRKGESLATLLNYAGGFASNAFKESLGIVRNTGLMKKVFNVDEPEWATFQMDDGDQVSATNTLDRFENMVEVKGEVFRPGMYQLGDKVSSVRSLVERSGGVKEAALLSRAVLSRMKPNRTLEVLPLDLEAILNGSAQDVPLKNEDVLYIPTSPEHQNNRTVTITGEVIAPGTFDFEDNMTLEDLILKAGGLTDVASVAKVDVSRRLRDANATEAGMQVSETFTFSLKDNYMVDGEKSFVLQPYDIVQVRRSPVYQDPITVTVAGEVTFKGDYTIEQKNQRLSDVVKAAGGILPGAYVRGSRLIRRMTPEERARLDQVLDVARQSASGQDSISIEQIAMEDTYTVGIHLDEALAKPGSTQDVELRDGDRLEIPTFNHTVRISGTVNAPNTVAFEKGKGYKYYVEQAGGFGYRARKSHSYIVYQNGTIAKVTKGEIEPGCEIVVPAKPEKKNNSAAQWVSVASGIATLGSVASIIAYLVKK